ncbi:serine/threonine protein kinase [Tritrichomonas musculus]|uniref:non-specific serine/threonine protein kinase n=1 Tax=Tritrichomonas musculus TaxID=1915356 RepID=A0ABR2KEV8_9EUKA
MKQKRRNSNLTFKMNNKIGAGCFGEVYAGECLQTGEKVAIKKEYIGIHSPQLLSEMKVIKTLNNPIGFPLFRGYWLDEGFHALAETLHGKNLSDIFHSCGHIFPIKTVYMLADQMISRLEFLHNKDIIHRDIKPENFLIGKGKKQNVIYLVDFGLSKFYRDPISHIHIPFREGKPLVGTARYVSLHVHEGIEPSRRDDLESLAYLLIYFAKGKLPWQRFIANDKAAKRRFIYEKKQSTPINILCEGLPQEFAIFLEYTRKLDFEEVPDYSYYKNMFRSALLRMGECYDYKFSWILPETDPIVESRVIKNTKTVIKKVTPNKCNQSQIQYPSHIHCLMVDNPHLVTHSLFPRSLDRVNFGHHLPTTTSKHNKTIFNKTSNPTPILSKANLSINKSNIKIISNSSNSNLSNNGSDALIRKSNSVFSNVNNTLNSIREPSNNYSNQITNTINSDHASNNDNSTVTTNINKLTNMNNIQKNTTINILSSSSNSNNDNKMVIRKSNSDFNNISSQITISDLPKFSATSGNLNFNHPNNFDSNLNADNKHCISNSKDGHNIISNNTNKATIRKSHSDFTSIANNFVIKQSSSGFDNDNPVLCSCCDSEISNDNHHFYQSNSNFSNDNDKISNIENDNTKNKISSSHSNINFYNINFNTTSNNIDPSPTTNKNTSDDHHHISLNESLFARYQTQCNPIVTHKGTPLLIKPAVSQNNINIDKYSSIENHSFGINNQQHHQDHLHSHQIQQDPNQPQTISTTHHLFLQLELQHNQSHHAIQLDHNQDHHVILPDQEHTQNDHEIQSEHQHAQNDHLPQIQIEQNQQNNHSQEQKPNKRSANIKHTQSHHTHRHHHHHEDDYVEQFEALHIKKATPSLWCQNIAFISKHLI